MFGVVSGVLHHLALVSILINERDASFIVGVSGKGVAVIDVVGLTVVVVGLVAVVVVVGSVKTEQA